MNDDNLNNAIKQVSSMLQDGDMSDVLKNLMNELNTSSPKEENSVGLSNDETEKMLKIAKNLFSNPNMKSDPKVNLLSSLKPYLNNHRKTKVDQCIKFLSMSKAMTLFKELE